MKGKKLIALLLGGGLAFSASNIQIYQGWNLLGVGNETINIKAFEDFKDKVTIIWTWDAENQKWKAYSPNPSIQALIEKYAGKGALEGVVNKISPFQGFWLLANEAFSINYQDTYNASDEFDNLEGNGYIFGEYFTSEYGNFTGVKMYYSINDVNNALNYILDNNSTLILREDEGIKIYNCTNGTLTEDKFYIFDCEASYEIGNVPNIDNFTIKLKPFVDDNGEPSLEVYINDMKTIASATYVPGNEPALVFPFLLSSDEKVDFVFVKNFYYKTPMELYTEFPVNATLFKPADDFSEQFVSGNYFQYKDGKAIVDFIPKAGYKFLSENKTLVEIVDWDNKQIYKFNATVSGITNGILGVSFYNDEFGKIDLIPVTDKLDLIVWHNYDNATIIEDTDLYIMFNKTLDSYLWGINF